MATKLFRTDSEQVQGVVLIGHGLNVHLDAMEEIVEVLLAQGFHCLQVSFYERTISEKASPEQVVAAWMEIFRDAVAEAQKIADGLPVHYVGYSLGGIIALYAQKQQWSEVSKAVYLAPPIRVTLFSKCIKLLIPFWRVGFCIPSLASVSFWARRSTPVNEYGALFRMIDEIHSIERVDLETVPTVLVVDKKDELVSYQKIVKWFNSKNLSTWKMWTIEKRAPSRRTYKHLIITKASLGEYAWKEMLANLVGHLKS